MSTGAARTDGTCMHGVRIAHRHGADLQLLLADPQRIDVGLAGRLERQRRGIEIRHAHVERHSAVVAQLRRRSRPPGLSMLHVAASELARDQAGDAARAVAALLDLGAVGVEDAIEDVGAGARAAASSASA